MLDIIVTCNIACKNATRAGSQEGQLFLQASFSVKTDRTIPKENLREIYKCLFQSEFDSSHQGLADVMALNKALFQSKLELTTEQIVNNSNTMILSTVQEDVQYLGKAHERLLIFNNRLYGDSYHSIIKKSLAKTLQTLVCHFLT